MIQAELLPWIHSLLVHDRPQTMHRIKLTHQSLGAEFGLHVLQIVREADGYQAHLVSPEFGLRRLVDEAIGMVLDPVNVCVRRVHQVLLDAARCAACALAHVACAIGSSHKIGEWRPQWHHAEL